MSEESEKATNFPEVSKRRFLFIPVFLFSCFLSLLAKFTNSLSLLSLGFLFSDSPKMIDFARVQKELLECSKDVEGSGIRVNLKGDNLARLIGTIPGPLGTPYEGGIFQIDITLPGISILNYEFRLVFGNYM